MRIKLKLFTLLLLFKSVDLNSSSKKRAREDTKSFTISTGSKGPTGSTDSKVPTCFTISTLDPMDPMPEDRLPVIKLLYRLGLPYIENIGSIKTAEAKARRLARTKEDAILEGFILPSDAHKYPSDPLFAFLSRYSPGIIRPIITPEKFDLSQIPDHLQPKPIRPILK